MSRRMRPGDEKDEVEVGWLSLLLGIDVAVAAAALAFIMQQQLLRIIVLTNEIAFKSNSRSSSIRSSEHVRTTCREFDSNLYLAVSVCF